MIHLSITSFKSKDMSLHLHLCIIYRFETRHPYWREHSNTSHHQHWLLLSRGCHLCCYCHQETWRYYNLLFLNCNFCWRNRCISVILVYVCTCLCESVCTCVHVYMRKCLCMCILYLSSPTYDIFMCVTTLSIKSINCRLNTAFKIKLCALTLSVSLFMYIHVYCVCLYIERNPVEKVFILMRFLKI